MQHQDYSIHYGSYNSIIVINPAGKLRTVYTPFRVFSKSVVGGKRRCFIVDEVFSDNRDKLLFQIGGKTFAHTHFAIEIQF